MTTAMIANIPDCGLTAEEFAQVDLLDLCKAYDLYIWTVFDSRIVDTGYVPVGIWEFLRDEYENVWMEHDDGENPFGYLYDE